MAKYRFRLRLLAAAAVVTALSFVIETATFAAESKVVTLRFNPPAGKVLNYESSSTNQMDFYGMTMTQNESFKVRVEFPDTTTEEGRIVRFNFVEVRGSIMRGEKFIDWKPPIKLEGKTVRAVVSSNGKVLKILPVGYIPGLKRPSDLKNILDTWFIELPDTTVSKGFKWTANLGEPESKNGKSQGKNGKATYEIKKFEKDKGVEVAVIQGKIEGSIDQDGAGGHMSAEIKGKVKAKVALNGGYVVYNKIEVDVKGKMVRTDPQTGEEISKDVVSSEYYECKLKD